MSLLQDFQQFDDVRIQTRRDTSANWTEANPVLLAGEEILVDTGNGELRRKIGDGVKTYTQLPFTDEKLRSMISDLNINMKDGTGEKSLVGNDIDNNQALSANSTALGQGTTAGSKGFRIIASSGTAGGEGTYTLENYTEGYEVGDQYSLRISNMYDRQGYITNINGNVISVNNFVADTIPKSGYNVKDSYTFNSVPSEAFGPFEVEFTHFYMDTTGNSYTTTYDCIQHDGFVGISYREKGGSWISASDTGAFFYAGNTHGYSYASIYFGTEYQTIPKELYDILVSHGTGTFTYEEVTGDVSTFRVESKPLLGDIDIGKYSFAIGHSTNALGMLSFAEGYATTAFGKYSHAEGVGTTATYSAHSEGKYTLASGQTSHAEGTQTESRGHCSHAEGEGTLASGFRSHAEGSGLVQSGEVITPLEAKGRASHAEGNVTLASGDASHAEGSNTVASGSSAHAEGNNSQSKGYGTHTEGNNTVAEGNGAHSEGEGCKATMRAAHAEGVNSSASGSISHAEGYNTQATAEASHSEGYQTQATGARSHSEGYKSVSAGKASHAEGSQTNAYGENSHTEGTKTSVEETAEGGHAEGYGTVVSGKAAHAEGNGNIASGNNSHAEGNSTIASGYTAHAQGNNTEASGDHSHAEGENTFARGKQSHAEGAGTQANAQRSHTEGEGTIASSATQHVQGRYNIEDTSGKYAHIVGNGSSSVPSNAHTLDWSGNAWFAGNVSNHKGTLATNNDLYWLNESFGKTIVQGTDVEKTFNSISNSFYDIVDGRSCHVANKTGSGVVSFVDVLSSAVKVPTNKIGAWLYWGGNESVSGVNIELTSSGKCDNQEIMFSPTLLPGWNYYLFDLTKSSSDPNLNGYIGYTNRQTGFNSSAINYIRIHSIKQTTNYTDNGVMFAVGQMKPVEDSITIGSTTITEEQLRRLLTLLDYTEYTGGTV